MFRAGSRRSSTRSWTRWEGSGGMHHHRAPGANRSNSKVKSVSPHRFTPVMRSRGLVRESAPSLPGTAPQATRCTEPANRRYPERPTPERACSLTPRTPGATLLNGKLCPPPIPSLAAGPPRRPAVPFVAVGRLDPDLAAGAFRDLDRDFGPVAVPSAVIAMPASPRPSAGRQERHEFRGSTRDRLSPRPPLHEKAHRVHRIKPLLGWSLIVLALGCNVL